ARLLAAAARLLADKVVEGAQADVQRCRDYAESSPAIATSLNRYLGYEEAASVAKQALHQQRSIADVVRARGHVDDGTITAEQLNNALDVLGMAIAPRSGDEPQ
ncbi:MAG: aspartate ammonia-lyase, partial [Pseudonocardiales bacterium]